MFNFAKASAALLPRCFITLNKLFEPRAHLTYITALTDRSNPCGSSAHLSFSDIARGTRHHLNYFFWKTLRLPKSLSMPTRPNFLDQLIHSKFSKNISKDRGNPSPSELINRICLIQCCSMYRRISNRARRNVKKNSILFLPKHRPKGSWKTKAESRFISA